MKKTIALVSALAVVFCCSFPVFAVTAPGKTITTSYNYGDVSVNVSVNAMPTDTQVVGTSHYEHRFTVTLTNKTNTFQVASTNMFGLKLYTGNNYTFDSTGTDSSGSVYNLGSWGSEVTSYSDNMTVPTVQFYNSNSDTFKGCVYITFKDSDLLVLNPNETRTYDFTIDFTCYLPASAVPLNGDIQFSYFTYNGNISIYNKPTSFTPNTIDEFIQNDSFPNSAIAWLMASYEQGIVDQQKYDQIISILMSHPNNITYGSNANNLFAQSYSVILYNDNFNTQSYGSIGHPIPISTNFDYNGIDFSSVSLNESSIYVVPIYIEYRIVNRSSNTYSSSAGAHWFHLPISNIVLDQGYYYGSDYEIIESDGLTLLNVGDDLYFSITEHADNLDIVTSGAFYRCVVKINRYFVINKTDNNISRPRTVYVTGFSPSNYSKPAFSPYNQTIYQSIKKSLSDIRDRIQSILDSYQANSSAAEDVTDSAESSSSTVDQQHQQESSIYDQTNQAVADTGIHNFQFDSQSLGGLGGVKNDFMAVWNALGSFNNIFITSLTIGLALSIIRHKRMFKS